MPRLKAISYKADSAKRRQLSWNLVDKQFVSSQSTSSIVFASNTENEIEIGIGTEKTGLIQPKKKIRKTKKNYMELLAPELQELIALHDYYITIKQKKYVKVSEVVCLLGHVDVILDNITAPYCLPNYPEFWLYVNEDDVTKSFVYFEEWDYSNDDSITVKYFQIEKLPPLCLMAGLRVKQYFVLCLHSYDAIQRKLSLGVLLRKTAVTELNFPSEAPRFKPNAAIQRTIQYLYDISPPDYSTIKRIRKHDINALYSAVKKIHSQNRFETINVGHRDLLPKLRPYQVNAVGWMLKQERTKTFTGENEIHQLYEEIKTRDNKLYYYNKYGGYLVRKKPIKVTAKPGGILADEMGLGKTVEVLACVLCNPRKNVESIFNIFDDIIDVDFEDRIKSNSARAADFEDSFKSNSARAADFEVANLLQNCVVDDNSPISSTSQSDSMTVDSLSVENISNNFFSCTCGLFESKVGSKTQVQCCECGMWQHIKCVSYDNSYGTYYCLHCWVAKTPIPSRATLIICPGSIQKQWLEEIQRHVQKDSLTIFDYSGVYKHGFVQPPKLADNDIVITTYEVLRKELHYVDLPHSNSPAGRKFRNPKRFMPIPSPLVAVEWWRICLDEAQMVETVSTRTADMALRLSAVNRWCITGTPIQKSIEDIYGLLLFLGTDPYSVKAWWRQCLYEPYCYGNTEPMHKLLSQVLWRTSKADVLDQIGLPEQTEEIHYMCFSPVEEYFYRQQHADCSREALLRFNKMHDWDMKLSSLDRKTLSNILGPVLRLRQACCHPQAVKGQFISIHKSTLTMEQLLEQLIKKTKVEAEEAHRQFIAASNGLAALFIIQEQWSEAAEKYRDVLRLAAEDMENVKTDKMQRLHALHNLAELIDAGHENIPPTLRDDTLKTEANAVRTSYLAKCSAKVTQAQELLRNAQVMCREVDIQLENMKECWWIDSLNCLERRNKVDELLERIRSDLLESTNSKKSSIVNQFRSLTGLKLVITNQLDSLNKAHDTLVKAVAQLDLIPDQKEVNAAVECHLRPSEKKQKCNYCRIHDLFNRYEGRLFCFSTENEERASIEPDNSEDALLGQLRRGTWANSEVERILKTILSFAKNHNAYKGENDEYAIDIKLFDVRKREFKALRAVWMQVRDYVSALDELNMATIRLRLRLPDEPKPDPPQPNILEPSEMNHHKLKLQSDQIIATNEKKKKLGQLLYLKNLVKSDLGKGKGNNPEPCPICQKTLGEQWSVLQCGHCFCVECVQVLVSHVVVRGRLRSVKCAICRQLTAPGEISYINTKGEDIQSDEIAVKGSYSTKVERIIRTLLEIRAKEPNAKALVFSTWQDVLDVLAKALHENKIKYCSLMTKNKFQNNLMKFKKNPNITVLLLPVQSGANGLNLIEATHVLLVEPILNPASELQAVGRIHRIGQNRATFVHRFLVRNTIEERMYSMLKSHCSKASSHETEENMLTINDLRNLFADDKS